MGGHRLSLEVMRSMAEEQGGECLSTVYVDLKTPMQWRCAVGHTWITQAQCVRYGHWCKQCNGKPVVSIEDMQQLSAHHGGECVSTTYVNIETPLKFRCTFDHEWRTTSKLVRAGYWCPTCANVKRRQWSRESNAHHPRGVAVDAKMRKLAYKRTRK